MFVSVPMDVLLITAEMGVVLSQLALNLEMIIIKANHFLPSFKLITFSSFLFNSIPFT